jgi:hypothetical protein
LISNDAVALAVAWHAAVAAACGALAMGWRPSRRWAAALLALPVASVGMLALRYGNGFNGLAFAGLALAMFATAVRMVPRPVAAGAGASTGTGLALIAYAWLYPHFLEPGSPALYLVAAPLGLIPCPTLSLVIGFTMLAGGLGSKTWCALLGAAGLFYGLFGVLRLGVWLDVPLAVAAVALFAFAVRPKIPRVQRRAPAL